MVDYWFNHNPYLKFADVSITNQKFAQIWIVDFTKVSWTGWNPPPLWTPSKWCFYIP